MDELLKAAEAVLAGIIYYGSGPAAPIFDEFDAEVERNRGSWCTVDGMAIEKLRKAVEAEKTPAPAPKPEEYRLCRECNNSLRVEDDGRLMPHFIRNGTEYCRGSACSCPEPEPNYRDNDGVLHQTVAIDGDCLAHGIHKGA